MEYELADIARPLLVMGGAVSLVMLGRELHRGWAETVTLKRLRRRAQERQKSQEEEKGPEEDQ